MTSIIQFHNQTQSDGYHVQCVNPRDAVYDEAKHMLVVVHREVATYQKKI